MIAHLFTSMQHKKALINPLMVLAIDPTACFDEAFASSLRKNTPDFNWQQALTLQVIAANNGDVDARSVVTKAYDYFATVTDPATIDLIDNMRMIAEANDELATHPSNR